MTQCPSCNEPLRLVIESGIEIDVCDECLGVWLDPGELTSLGKDFAFRHANSTPTQRPTSDVPDAAHVVSLLRKQIMDDSLAALIAAVFLLVAKRWPRCPNLNQQTLPMPRRYCRQRRPRS